uniref:Uncharacterized protein n=1 Tax=Zooxanthella nutricula TaxID=1333877 RepID=A0A6V0IQA6_9DINO|mmetsp:Transcript_28566/g.86272  ORF Transcript_28566/g.86272 Transcript_28566/m.86272 type:complete len:140 (+) Transcript_28566:79-498(+)
MGAPRAPVGAAMVALYMLVVVDSAAALQIRGGVAASIGTEKPTALPAEEGQAFGRPLMTPVSKTNFLSLSKMNVVWARQGTMEPINMGPRIAKKASREPAQPEGDLSIGSKEDAISDALEGESAGQRTYPHRAPKAGGN